MTDLASLGIRVEGQEVVTADAQLDGLAAAAAKAETATDRLALAARGNGAAMMTMNTAVRQQTAVLSATRNSMGLTTAEGLNMGRQMSDVGVQLAMGMSPFMIAVQQGPQIFDVFQMAAIRAGTTVRAAMVATGAAVWTALAPLLPVIAGIAVVAGTVAAAWGLATRSISTGVDNVTRGMGLTEAQMKKLKEAGIDTGVTMGDVFRGLGTTIKEMFVETFGTQLSWVKDRWTDFLDTATRWALAAVKGIGGAFVGAFYAVRDTWQMLPAVIGDAAVSSANIALRAVEFMINKGVEGINRLILSARALSAVNPAFAAANSVPLMNAISTGQMGNANAGAMGRAGSQAGSSFGRGMSDFGSGVDAFGARWRQNSLDSARDRIRDGAGDADGGGRAARQARQAREELVKLADVDVTPLNTRLDKLVDPLRTIADELRLIDQLAQDTAQGLTSAFGESGRALGDLLTTMSGYQSRMAEINLAEREFRLSGAQADRERAQAQIQNYGDMASAARGFFAEGSDGYRILLAIEQAYRIQQMIGMVQAMAVGKTETAASVAGSAVRGAASMAAGAARMFEALGPYAFPAVAAMLGLLAGLGLRGGGGGRSSGVPAANDNSPDASTAAVRAQTNRQTAAASGAMSGMAQRVQVVVTADREGMNAFVVDTAEGVAAPIAAQFAATSYAATRADMATSQRRARQRFV